MWLGIGPVGVLVLEPYTLPEICEIERKDVLNWSVFAQQVRVTHGNMIEPTTETFALSEFQQSAILGAFAAVFEK